VTFLRKRPSFLLLLGGQTRRLRSDVCESERSCRRSACCRKTKLFLNTTTTLSNTDFQTLSNPSIGNRHPFRCVVQCLKSVNISVFVTRFGVRTLRSSTVTGVNSHRMRDEFLSNCTVGTTYMVTFLLSMSAERSPAKHSFLAYVCH
jgi:hypothetical protein